MAHIRYLREVRRMSCPQISQEFKGLYALRYIISVCNYEVRPFIKPKEKVCTAQ